MKSDKYSPKDIKCIYKQTACVALGINRLLDVTWNISNTHKDDSEEDERRHSTYVCFEYSYNNVILQNIFGHKDISYIIIL